MQRAEFVASSRECNKRCSVPSRMSWLALHPRVGVCFEASPNEVRVIEEPEGPKVEEVEVGAVSADGTVKSEVFRAAKIRVQVFPGPRPRLVMIRLFDAEGRHLATHWRDQQSIDLR